MKKIVLALTILCIATLTWGIPSLMTPENYVKEFGGDINVYARILTLLDCAALQQEFDQAEAEGKHTEHGSPRTKNLVGYMTAAADRLQAIECEDSPRNAPFG